jgi:hypothetical protein
MPTAMAAKINSSVEGSDIGLMSRDNGSKFGVVDSACISGTSVVLFKVVNIRSASIVGFKEFSIRGTYLNLIKRLMLALALHKYTCEYGELGAYNILEY